MSRTPGTTISIAMTTYNGAAYVREQLDSIFAQGRLPDELIVGDDQSTDGTADLLDEYAARAPFPMTIIRNPARLGSTKNFEQAISRCSGEIIALADQDDVWYPHKLARIERAFGDDPDVGLVFSNGDLIDADGVKLRGSLWASFAFTPRRQAMLKSPREACELLLSLPVVTGATMAFRTKLLPVLAPFPTDSPTFVHDRWIAALTCGFAKVRALDERLIGYRIHAQQQIGTGQSSLFRRYTAPHRCASDLAAMKVMRDRLDAVQRFRPNDSFLTSLATRLMHMGNRADYPHNPLTRLPKWLSEYWSGRYTLYPYGRRHAIKDLVVGTR